MAFSVTFLQSSHYNGIILKNSSEKNLSEQRRETLTYVYWTGKRIEGPFSGAFCMEEKTAVLIYGKRRVGKSTLIKEAAKEFGGVVINHLCVTSTFDGNLKLIYCVLLPFRLYSGML